MTLQYKKIEKIVKGFANHRRIQVLELLEKTPNLSVDDIEIVAKNLEDLSAEAEENEKKDQNILIINKTNL